MGRTIEITDVILRDAHQSLLATRMAMEDMVPACEDLDNAGYWSLECWGGATFDSCIRFLNEDPWERLRRFRRLLPKTRLQMLLRGQNLLGYSHYQDAVVERFVDRAAENGMDVFRVFDALNDLRNLKTALAAVRKAGKHAQGTICYTVSPVHTIDAFVEMAQRLKDLGVDSICIKDMAGLLTPRVTYNLVKAIKHRHSISVVVHSHDTAGLALASYISAIDAGADVVETSITPFANGTGQPDTVRMLAALAENPRIPHYDTKSLFELRQYFEGVAKELAAFMSPANDRVDSDALTFQVPGGMLSNFRNQLKEMKMENKFPDVMAEVPVVREALGWIPLVTPTSQIVGTQAMLNVKFGRWQNLAQSTIDVALGKFGRPPGSINPELLALAKKKSGQEPVEGRPADLLPPRLPAIREELAKKNIEPTDDNDVLYAMFPRETDALYNKKAPAAAPAPQPVAIASPGSNGSAPRPAAVLGVRKFFITINNHRSEVLVEELS